MVLLILKIIHTNILRYSMLNWHILMLRYFSATLSLFWKKSRNSDCYSACHELLKFLMNTGNKKNNTVKNNIYVLSVETAKNYLCYVMLLMHF